MTDLIPVIRGKMGGREYYVGTMTFQDVAAKIQFFDELSESTDLDQLLQREIQRRSEEMKEYLLKQEERFYGALIVAAWGGNPNYIKVRMEDHPLLNDDFEYGILKFDNKVSYFALDGQHRLKSIQDAIQENSDLRLEEISVVFVTHERTETGNIRTRRLFHTLNRYAKPTTTGENVAIDEDNVVSICTRMLLKSGMRIFDPNNVELRRKNLTKTQTDKVTSLAALYDFNFAVLDAVYPFSRSYLRFRPDAMHVENIFNAISSLWIDIRGRMPVMGDVEQDRATPGEVRDPDGVPEEGHLLFRPLGLRIYGTIIAAAVEDVGDFPIELGAELDPVVWSQALDRIDALPLALGELPWRGTILRGRRIATGGRGLASRLALYMLGLGGGDVDKLRQDYRELLNDSNADLPAVRSEEGG